MESDRVADAQHPSPADCPACPTNDELRTTVVPMGDGHELEELLKQVVDGASDIVIITEASPLNEPGPRIVYVNESFTSLTGYSPEEVLGRSPRLLQRPDLIDTSALGRVRAALDAREPIKEVVLNFAKDGTGYWLDMRIFPLRDAAGTITHFAAIERDVTADVRRMQEYHRQAMVDPLTGLLNRRGLDLVAPSVWLDGVGLPGSVITVDLDDFKLLNDRFGHSAGDEALVRVAELLLGAVRETDLVGRLGGDEFVAVLGGVPASAAADVATRFLGGLAADRRAGRTHELLTVSVGVASVARMDVPLEAVLGVSDDAMYRAKQAGGDRFLLVEMP